jgi:hypothetical protein
MSARAISIPRLRPTCRPKGSAGPSRPMEAARWRPPDGETAGGAPTSGARPWEIRADPSHPGHQPGRSHSPPASRRPAVPPVGALTSRSRRGGLAAPPTPHRATSGIHRKTGRRRRLPVCARAVRSLAAQPCGGYARNQWDTNQPAVDRRANLSASRYKPGPEAEALHLEPRLPERVAMQNDRR